MALVKCPDCGKMVSPRATSCPVCGCPAEFFEKNPDEKKDADGSSDEKSEEIKKKPNVEQKPLDIFSFMGRKIIYPQSAVAYIKAIREHNSLGAVLAAKLEEQYVSAKTIDHVIDETIPRAQKAIDEIVKENVAALYNVNIYISEDEFKEKYKIDIYRYTTCMFDAYDHAIAEANQLAEQRAYERAGRSRWEGGGFGVRGAIKGAAKAGALNAVTGIGRAIGDSFVDSGDSEKLQKAKKQIYNNKAYRDQLLNGFRFCIRNADYGMAEEFANKGLTNRIYINSNKALQIYEAADKYEKDTDKKIQKIIDAVEIHPMQVGFYGMLLEAAKSDEDVDEILRFMKFWGMEEDYKSVFVQWERKKVIDAYLDKHSECLDIDFQDFSPATYVKIRDIRKALRQEIKSNQLPHIVTFCKNLDDYFGACIEKEFCLDSLDIIGNIDEEMSMAMYFARIHDEKKELPDLLKEIWVWGDDKDISAEKLKNKWNIPYEDTVYMYQNKAVFGTLFGGKGFILTSSLICDLNSKDFIRLSAINSVECDEINPKIYIKGNQREIIIDISDEKPITKRFLRNCIEAAAVLYGEETSEEKRSREIRISATKILGIISEYAERNNQDTFELLEKFLISKGIIEEKPEYMFCPYCGKQIERTAKFCNYCGKLNTYAK